MKRTGLIIITLVITFTILSIAIFWIVVGNPFNPLLAEYRLQSALQSLPTIPDAVVIKYWKGTSGGSEQGCGALVVEELIGTNDLSLPQVLNYYDTSLPAKGWKADVANKRGQSFHQEDEFYFAVSDLYDSSHVAGAGVVEAKSKFKTVFLLELSTPLNVSSFNKCQEQ